MLANVVIFFTANYYWCGGGQAGQQAAPPEEKPEMQPKCLKIDEGTGFSPDGACLAVQQRGTPLLNSFAIGDPAVILLNQNQGGDVALYILGGRSSIVSWLRLQGDSPVIRTDGAGQGGRFLELRVKVWRKHRTFEKDLTLVAVHARKKEPMGNLFGWEDGGGARFGENGLGWKDTLEVTPMQLGNALAREFRL
jgi:hypothetical protein